MPKATESKELRQLQVTHNEKWNRLLNEALRKVASRRLEDETDEQWMQRYNNVKIKYGETTEDSYFCQYCGCPTDTGCYNDYDDIFTTECIECRTDVNNPTNELTKEAYDKQTEALNEIAEIVSKTPGLEYNIAEMMPDGEIPENATLQYGIDEAAEISVFREMK